MTLLHTYFFPNIEPTLLVTGASLLVTGATLVVTGALLLVTRKKSYLKTSLHSFSLKMI